jgi:hypothetical protein
VKYMRNLHLESAIWYLFTSAEFFEATAMECEKTMEWFGTLAISRQITNFGRNNQIYDKFKQRACDFRRAAELARLGDYRLLWDVSDFIRGDARGMLEQPLHSWMNEAEYQEFSDVRMGRLLAYAGQITRSLNNAMVKGHSFFHPSPDCPERRDDDDGFPGDEIVKVYDSKTRWYKDLASWKLPDPLPEYVVDATIACHTGDEVPWTGVWHPGTGLEKHSLTFAIKGMRMQPAFRVTKTKEDLKAEGVLLPTPKTVAVATTWHAVIPSGRQTQPDKELWSKAGEPCPKAGIWRPTDPGAAPRTYQAGETMADIGSAFGLTVWRWVAER